MIKIIAELSMNFGDNICLGKRMIESAANSGCNIVKTQIWRVKNLRSGEWDLDGRKKQYKDFELDETKCNELIKCCKDNGVEFLVSCFNVNDLDFIKSLGCKSIKIPSPECSNTKLVIKAIDMFDTIYISTGASLESEYKDYPKVAPNKIFLLHTTSSYPLALENVNMNRMLHLKKYTENIGFSGHAESINDAILAISLQAKVIEKHFTTDRNLPFRDNQFSILPHELKSIRKYADDYEKMMIDRGNDYQECEEVVRKQYSRRWCK